ncbi:MAG: radical SAM protein [Candidatus Aminicenantales bacterium]
MEEFGFAYRKGWYPEESDRCQAFRWMGKKAVLALKNRMAAGPTVLQITAAHTLKDEHFPVLEVLVNGRKIGEKKIHPFFFTYIFPFIAEGERIFELRLNRTFQIPTDSRELGMMVRNIKIHSLSGDTEPLYGEGWYDWEPGDLIPYHWMAQEAEIIFPSIRLRDSAYFSFFAYSEFMSGRQVLRLSLGESNLGEIPLLNKWNYYSFSFSEASGHGPIPILHFSLDRLFPERFHPDDPRNLGIRMGALEFHSDSELHRNAHFFHRNALLNFREMKEGRTVLKSYPLNLGVDLYPKCNIYPPCVYCLWERMKKLEGPYVNQVVDERTLEGYGPFFHSARTIINCSFGEPLLHPRFPEILALCQRNRKYLEISTNGQAFTSRTIQALAGKQVYLYVSLDAATKETYAKIRNDSWDGIIPSLIRLNAERKKQGNLPKLYMVFMPMKVNRGDLEEYFRLCRKIEADTLVLRPLLFIWKPQIKVERGGYIFDYEKELLSRPEINAIIQKSEELSLKYAVKVSSQFDFGKVQKPG